MARFYSIALEDGALAAFEQLPKNIQKATMQSLNKTLDRGRTMSAKLVRQQVNFPASYVSPSEGRLVVRKKASESSPEGIISARVRPTSLARFATRRPRSGQGQNGVNVSVKPGTSRFMRSAFFIKLRRGNIDTAYNMGLAVRTRGNVRPSAAYRPVQMRNGLWLLYGPSVSQALLSAKETGVWPTISPKLLDYAADEFLRLMEMYNAR